MSSTGRTWLQTLAAGLLAWGGAAAIVYAGFLPLPPFSDVPIPLVWQVLGIVGLAAAVGVFLGQAWSQALGVGVAAIDLALLLFRVAAQASRSGPLEVLATLTVGVVLNGVVLWVLLRRWPALA